MQRTGSMSSARRFIAPALLLAVVLVTALGNAGGSPPTGDETSPSGSGSDVNGVARASADVPQGTMAQGQELFAANCAVCHGPGGEGDVGPALDDPERVAAESEVIVQVLRGSMYMPPFASKLDDEQIAAVITFVRNSFGNDYGPTTPEDVAEQR